LSLAVRNQRSHLVPPGRPEVKTTLQCFDLADASAMADKQLISLQLPKYCTPAKFNFQMFTPNIDISRSFTLIISRRTIVPAI
jgi:hypothetical protein